jgi:hypothetical protein
MAADLSTSIWPGWLAIEEWTDQVTRLRSRLLEATDLTGQLLQFVQKNR